VTIPHELPITTTKREVPWRDHGTPDDVVEDVAADLLVRPLEHRQQVQPGHDPDHVVIVAAGDHEPLDPCGAHDAGGLRGGRLLVDRPHRCGHHVPGGPGLHRAPDPVPAAGEGQRMPRGDARLLVLEQQIVL